MLRVRKNHELAQVGASIDHGGIRDYFHPATVGPKDYLARAIAEFLLVSEKGRKIGIPVTED